MVDKPQISLSSVIRAAIDASLNQVHTCLPAVVISIDVATHLIDVQVTIKRKLKGALVNLPVLQGVPLRHIRTSVFAITMPVKVGDHVELRICERSIDTWLTEGGIQDPVDVRKFSLNDAFATPNMYHQKEITSEPMDADNLQIKVNDGSGEITITPSGQIQLNGSTNSIIDYTNMLAAFNLLRTELNAVITAYNAHTHGASPGPSVPGVSAIADMSGAEVPTVKVP